MRGDSYQLQGQGGGVVIIDTEYANGKFRSLLVLATGIVDIRTNNISSPNGTILDGNIGSKLAGTIINAPFTQCGISGASSQAICYYE